MTFDDWFDKKPDKKEEPPVDRFPHLTALVPKVREYLEDKERVALPELQLLLGISFEDTRQLINVLKEHDLLIGNVEGLYIKTNRRIIVAPELEYEEIMYIAAALRKVDTEALSKFKNGALATESKLAACANLIKEGVIFEAEGQLFLAYAKTSIDAILGLALTEEDWFLEKVVSECLSAILEHKELEGELDNIHMLPADIVSAVRERLPAVRKSGKPPRPIRRALNHQRLKFRFIENALQYYDFNDAPSYRDAVRREITVASRLGLAESDLLAVMRAAEAEIADLSIKSIKEIRSLIITD